jgi:hypothetical protein
LVVDAAGVPEVVGVAVDATGVVVVAVGEELSAVAVRLTSVERVLVAAVAMSVVLVEEDVEADVLAELDRDEATVPSHADASSATITGVQRRRIGSVYAKPERAPRIPLRPSAARGPAPPPPISPDAYEVKTET